MTAIHVANTDFEFELEQTNDLSIEQSWARHPLCLQLQYIPLLYAKPHETIAVTSSPSPSFIRYLLDLNFWEARELPIFIPLSQMGKLPYTKCYSWGFSKKVAIWSEARHLAYKMPDWIVIQEVNSKLFSFNQSPFMAGSKLIWNPETLKQWLNENEEVKVIKTCFGVSGRGNRIINNATSFASILPFCQKEWQHKRPIIGEPWQKRVLDFSTQWEIGLDGKIERIGATVFETDEKGRYCATLAGPEALLFKQYYTFLIQHQEFVRNVLEIIRAKGFFGPLGIDAFIYLDSNNTPTLRPIVEINGRQTMSVAALRFQQRWLPSQVVRFSFNLALSAENSISLLPAEIKHSNKTILFNRRLILSQL